jgi:D-amino peptidase
MKILIAVDMEGITGVVSWNHVASDHPEYARFRKLMTYDVNAAIRGAFEGGASDVLVADGHGYGRNILIEELDERARLNSGTPSPFSMVQGIDSGVNAVMYVGYHARIGTQNAILEHTWSDERVANLWINGDLFGEIGLNAAVSGHFNAPVIMISGDQSACAEAAALLHGIETAVVKYASGRMAAELLPPGVTHSLIQAAATRAVQRFQAGQAPQPLKLPPPITMTIDFVQSEMADRAVMLPGATRSGRRLQYTAPDMPTLYSAFRTALALARG